MKDEIQEVQIEELEERIAPSGFGPSTTGTPVMRFPMAPSRIPPVTDTGIVDPDTASVSGDDGRAA